jgi:hypothetical protein
LLWNGKYFESVLYYLCVLRLIYWGGGVEKDDLYKTQLVRYIS